MAPPIRLYTTRICAYCVRAKILLDAKGAAYEEIDVSGDHASRAWLMETTGRRTVPQIFFGEEPIGGFDELRAMDVAGELDRRLASET